jgi:hypothetical protein
MLENLDPPLPSELTPEDLANSRVALQVLENVKRMRKWFLVQIEDQLKSEVSALEAKRRRPAPRVPSVSKYFPSLSESHSQSRDRFDGEPSEEQIPFRSQEMEESEEEQVRVSVDRDEEEETMLVTQTIEEEEEEEMREPPSLDLKTPPIPAADSDTDDTDWEDRAPAKKAEPAKETRDRPEPGKKGRRGLFPTGAATRSDDDGFGGLV